MAYKKTSKIKIRPIRLNKLVINVRRLGREAAAGMALADDRKKDLIEIDEEYHKSLGEKHLFNTYIHELLHLISEDFKEKEIVSISNSLTKILWKLGYRRVRLK